MILFVEYFSFSFILLLLYIKFAQKLCISDQPNERSSHLISTYTGAGFVFPLAFVIPLLISSEYIHNRAIITGLFLLTCISFLDDLQALRKMPRVLIQVVAVALLLWQTGGIYKLTIWTLVPAFIFVVGIINAYNFMDGINSITAFYSISTIATLFYLSGHGYQRLPGKEVFIALLASLVAFGWFNARVKAILFCGDVGSITLAFVISFLIIQMMIYDDSSKWILLIGVYGLDTVATIVLRIVRKENVTLAHRTHFYQFLVIKKKLPHIVVALFYSISQIIINIFLIFSKQWTALLVYLFFVGLYIILRYKLEGPRNLFTSYAES